MKLTAPITASELEAEIRGAYDRFWETVEEYRRAIAEAERLRTNLYSPFTPEIKKAEKLIESEKARMEEARAKIAELTTRHADLALQEKKTTREDRDFWFRRFMVSLQVGNGAAFLATIAGLLQADAKVLSVIAALVWAPTIYFGLGVAAAGLLPLAMAGLRHFDHPVQRRFARSSVLILTTASIGFFGCGLGSVITEVTQLREPAIRAANAKASPAQVHPVNKPANPPARRP